MPDPIFLIGEIPDQALRQLARNIRTNGITRQAAFEALLTWRGAVAFDGGERLVIETLFDEIESLPE